MKYLIQKTLYGKFNYWLGKDGVWQGLRDNGGRFDEITAHRKMEHLRPKKNEEIRILHSYRESNKTLED